MKNYFTITELLNSDTAKAKGIKNVPSDTSIYDALHLLITECLNPIREKYGKPIRVTSGYRCASLNVLVGGKATSQHLKGEAVDLQGANEAETRRIFEIAKLISNHDQLLFETNKRTKWVHISYKAKGNRLQTIDNYNAI